jgi:subtilase family serine protease
MKTLCHIAAVTLLAASSLAHGAAADRAIRGSTVGLVKTQQPIGAHAASSKLAVTITLKNRNAAALKKLDAQLGQPGFKPLTQAQWQAKFAPSQKQLDAVSTWAKSQGLKVSSINGAAGDVQVGGTTAKLEAAFKTPINDYATANGTVFANAKNISVPKALPISGVLGLDDIRVARPLTAK